jgi:hypothetical protein
MKNVDKYAKFSLVSISSSLRIAKWSKSKTSILKRMFIRPTNGIAMSDHVRPAVKQPPPTYRSYSNVYCANEHVINEELRSVNTP